MDELGSRESDDAERWSRLTEKQRACLDLLVERKTSKQIARELGIAKVTVDQRIRAARNILSASDRDETAIIYSRLKPRSEERRGGKECVSTGRYRWST